MLYARPNHHPWLIVNIIFGKEYKPSSEANNYLVVEKYFAFYATPEFITVFTTCRYFHMNPIRTIPTYYFKIHSNIILLYLPSYVFSPGFPT
jgi:hypothetical protein